MFKSYFESIKNSFVFSGRASRREFWSFFVVNMIAAIIFIGLDLIFGTINTSLGVGVLSGLYILFISTPSLSLMVRRIHDLNKSGYYIFLTFIPLLGHILVIYWACAKGSEDTNLFGESVSL